MIEQSRIDYLSSLRNEIAAMSIVKCRMVHERVIRLADSNQSVLVNKRVGLCSPDVRAQRLSCGHTMSRVRLDRAIDELESGIAEPLRYELNWLTNEIHLLDHRKGEAEVQRARAEQDVKRGREESNELELIKELERQHDEYTDKMGVLRNKVVAEIDKVIADLQQ